jgi:hypothetical protein
VATTVATISSGYVAGVFFYPTSFLVIVAGHFLAVVFRVGRGAGIFSNDPAAVPRPTASSAVTFRARA